MQIAKRCDDKSAYTVIIVVIIKIVMRCDKNRVEYAMYKLSHICIYKIKYSI